jgi:hypothetical protein
MEKVKLFLTQKSGERATLEETINSMRILFYV